MAKKSVVVAPKKLLDKKGKEKKEYPKLVRVSEDKKVLVQNEDEEAALNLNPQTETKPAAKTW